MSALDVFEEIFAKRKAGIPAGIYSVCSANPIVLQAAMEQAAEDGMPVLIEATANQVNQFGGYTGMNPCDFYGFVHRMAEKTSLAPQNILLGGDHLGPLVWRSKPAGQAMELAEELVSAYVLAGFEKIHLDTSMHLASDDPSMPLADEVVAARGARLCAAAEKAYQQRLAMHPQAAPPIYVIGSEVPVPGGMQHETDELTPTSPEAFMVSYRAFKEAFEEKNLQNAFNRVVAFVVQPGVEFGGETVIEYNPAAAAALCGQLKKLERPLLFEGHSTDYQRPELLRKMVEDGIAILKVGPALTFALREGLMALEMMEQQLVPGTGMQLSDFSLSLEKAMLDNPENWQVQLAGDERNQRLQRFYSYYDRARYYLPVDAVQSSVEQLMHNLQQLAILPNMLSQYLPYAYEQYRQGRLDLQPEELLKYCVRRCLQGYAAAVNEDAGGNLAGRCKPA